MGSCQNSGKEKIAAYYTTPLPHFPTEDAESHTIKINK
jgi:hypothetical protein